MSTVAHTDIAEVLGAVLRATQPRLALPAIAHNHSMTLAELERLLGEHGYPDKNAMKQSFRALLDATDNLSTNASGSAAPAAGKRDPYVAALSVSVLFADPAYQRELDQARVQQMVEAYDPALVGIIEVSQRGTDSYAILDGQHRWAVERDRQFDLPGTPHIACRVHTGLTVAEEAKLYHQLNTTRRQLTGWDRWLARRAAGEQVVVDIEATLAQHGLKVALRGGGDVFRATRTAEKIVELNGLALLDQVVGVVRAAWPDDQAGLDGYILHGLAHVLDNYGRDELDVERLIAELAGIMPRQMAARAAAVRELHKGTMDRLTGHVIVERYNASKGRKLESFFVRVKPITKTKTQKVKQEAAYRAAALSWARETTWNGTIHHPRMGRDLLHAFVEAGEPGAPGRDERQDRHPVRRAS